MPEIRLASEELAALEIVREPFAGSFSGKNHALDHFLDAYHMLKPVLERRVEEDTDLGEAAQLVGLAAAATARERIGARLRRAVELAAMSLSDRIVDAELADA